MFGVIAYHGSDTPLFESACHTARSLGADVHVVVSTPNLRIATMGNGLSVAAVGQTALFGSSAYQASRMPIEPGKLLDGAPEDVVAVAIHQDSLVLAAGKGNHRLFVHETEKGTLVSSSLTVLARTSSTPIDRSYEDFLLGFSFLPMPRTPYVGIRAITPGTREIGGVIENIAGQVIESSPVPSSFSHAIPEVRDRFFSSLEELTVGEKRHAVLLGGFDSMLVAASLRKMGHEVHTYTYSFGDPTFDQRNVDEFVSSQGIHHHSVVITPELIADNLENFGSFFFQPGALAHYQIHTLVASQQIAADGHRQIFNGDGCDALFLSYPTVNRRAAVNARLEKIPNWSLKLGSSLLRNSMTEKHLGHVGRTMRSVLGNLQLDEPARGHLPNRYLDDYALSLLRTGDGPLQNESVEDIRNRLAKDVEGQIGTRRAFHGNGITGQSKVKVDGCVASTGLPHFTPYTHPLFRSYIASLPIDYLKNQKDSPGANGKEILVAMVREFDLLPDAIINQPKQSPSDSPIDQWFQNELRSRVLKQLEHLPFEWNRNYVETVLQQKRAEQWYREKITMNHHALQVISLLTTYASFNRAISE